MAVDDEGSGDGAGSGVSYEWFVGLFNSALSAVNSNNTVMLNDVDADVVRQVAVLYRVTQLAVRAVAGRSSTVTSSLLNLSSRCYEEMFAARVANEQGLVSMTSLCHHHQHTYTANHSVTSPRIYFRAVDLMR